MKTKRVMKTRILKISFILFAFLSITILASSQIKSINQYEVSEKGAWCWFADPRALHYQNGDESINKSFIGYIDIQGNIKATQHDFITGETKEVLVRSWFQPDDHDNPTFLILPDERIMIFYSRHTDEPCFYYRVSEKKCDLTTLGKEYKIETRNNTTYPSPFILSDDPEHIYLLWRGVSWHPTIAKLTLPDENDQVKIVMGPQQVVQSTASRPYAKYTCNGKDKIYIAYTTGHPDPTMPNYIYFNYIDIHTMELKDIRGNVLSNVCGDIYHVSATEAYVNKYPYAVVDDTQLRDWLWQVVVKKDGNPVVAMVRINEDKSSHDYYYAYWDGEAWKKTFLSNAGGHFHQSPDIEKCYSAGMAIDEDNPNQVYCSVPVNGKYGKVYEIIKYTIGNNYDIQKTDTLTRDSKLNNSRPYIIKNSQNSPMKLVWMNGNYYDWIVSKQRPQGFCTSIFADYDLYSDSADIKSDLVVEKKFIDAHNTNEIKVKGISEEFSIIANFNLDSLNYQGVFVKLDDVSYSIDAKSLRPYLLVDTKKYESNNILATSDSWKDNNRGTNGVWYKPVKYTDVQLSLIYEKGVLSIYINGLLSQTVSKQELKLKSLELGDKGIGIENVKVYDRVLSNSDVKALLIN